MDDQGDVLARLEAVLEQRRTAAPEDSYVASLHAKGAVAILAKISEEAQEVIEAGRDDDNAHLVHEVADLWFHCMVLLSNRGLSVADVTGELASRFGVSGLAEKAARRTGTRRT
ncbi:MAG: phosphoribosyl-ATP diphosphatase [Salinisphaera sp.]|nr:phosphoribosyl-ATP diphosphatase [Salinisphaera sp.]